jgi:hypothetical protein
MYNRLVSNDRLKRVSEQAQATLSRLRRWYRTGEESNDF